MKKPTRRLQRTAYHEAGHAVLANLFRIPTTLVTIVPNDEENYLGAHVRRVTPIDRRMYASLEAGSLTPGQRIRLEHVVMMEMAGYLAERRWAGRGSLKGADSDYRSLIDLCLSVCGGHVDATEAYLHWLDIMTVHLLELHWSSVEAVAQALLSNSKLTGKQLQQVIWDGYRSANQQT